MGRNGFTSNYYDQKHTIASQGLWPLVWLTVLIHPILPVLIWAADKALVSLSAFLVLLYNETPHGLNQVKENNAVEQKVREANKIINDERISRTIYVFGQKEMHLYKLELKRKVSIVREEKLARETKVNTTSAKVWHSESDEPTREYYKGYLQQ
jgi:hypothetical protein